MKSENKFVMVIHEKDLEDKDRRVIGVATTREDALKMITEYYGKDAVMTEFKDIREDSFDFSCKIVIPSFLGGIYEVWVEDFELNNI